MSKTVTETINELHSSLSDYIEATYHISDPTLVAQRKELLSRLGVIYQQPYLESTPKYVAGKKFDEITNLPEAARKIYEALSAQKEGQPKLIYNPPYKHQFQAVEECLVKGKNLVIMTGTGSGKTESFLLPIIGKLAREANESPQSFSEYNAVRALILYPMNALVNDQLGRLRNLFGDVRLKSYFKDWCGRIPTFSRYTSRTPYPGVRSSKKDQHKLKAIEDFYVEIERATYSEDEEQKAKALKLLNQLKSKGKWPAKPNLSKWYGAKGEKWQSKDEEYLRAVCLPEDSELITRHEVQATPPDLMITNYSMLEYMLMRPIERSIFEDTLLWLADNPKEKFLVVLDEAHLYRGAAGAEVGLLLRRLRDRLGIPPERFQVICATASFESKEYAPEFASKLAGVPAESFVSITGEYDHKKDEQSGTEEDAKALTSVDLEAFYNADNETRSQHILSFLKYRKVSYEKSVEYSLYNALKNFGPLSKLINITMGQAKPIVSLSSAIFPKVDSAIADQALTNLLALGSMARESPVESGLLPCRIHNFFRGLPGLWICTNQQCSEIPEEQRGGIGGKLYSQPRERCDCGARVFEFYTCRNCGSAHAKAYTDNLDSPSSLWSEPGHRIRLTSAEITDFYPLDLLLEEPVKKDKTEPVILDISTGRINPENLGEDVRTVYLRRERTAEAVDDEDDDASEESSLGEFSRCAVCSKGGGSRGSPVQDHQTKGDPPFLSLLSRQIQIQPPSSAANDTFAPLRGRKVLIFSDSRQIAAKLAPNLQMYSVRDALRPLLVWGLKTMQANQYIAKDLCLDDAYLAILIAANQFGVRLRPELQASENFFALDQQIRNEIQNGILNDEMGFYQLFVNLRGEKAPESLLKDIVSTLADRFLGLEALALASICEKERHQNSIEKLPDIPGLATTKEAKLALVRFWIRCWQGPGYWLRDMPGSWWKPSAGRIREGVKGHKSGKFNAIKSILVNKQSEKIFYEQWLPELKKIFTDDMTGTYRITGKNLSLYFGENWIRCKTCSSVHKAIPNIDKCLECGSHSIGALKPDEDEVFMARKGYYRRGVKGIFSETPVPPMALIAAEHTAQLNAPQSEDVFSKAEENELLFQDIDIEWPLGHGPRCAIDILSSTTTMEVGIDIGALSGAALRNMPPGRANYQQRAGRAGRRGNAVATVVAFGSVDSHDEHYFSHPDEMISGPVVDPIITLNNVDIVKRHVRAFLLQKYHQARLPDIITPQQSNLFSVLGKVKDFVQGNGVLNRNDFAAWLKKHEKTLQERVNSWIPEELTAGDRTTLIENLIEDCLEAVDDAIDYKLYQNTPPNTEKKSNSENSEEENVEVIEEEDLGKSNLNDNLLDRLLYRGKLPRYAFPTDVATFHVFDENKSTSFRPVMKFAPSQGLPVALTQYAPDRQVWISNKCYTSGAIYSPIKTERSDAWKKRRLYYECEVCGFAETEDFSQEKRQEIRDCEACGEEGSFGPPRPWVVPPGFAHPIDLPEETSPEGIPDVSYATRAKLAMPFQDTEQWISINDRMRALKVRKHLLVSNTGPAGEGYHYCVKCGRIEAATNSSGILGAPHNKPYPDDEGLCPAGGTSRIVLGTDFITDIGLFSISLEPLKLKPSIYSTNVALRTLCEALAKAASGILEIEPNDIIAEFRPALNSRGRTGKQVEIFLYDTLPGGAGFSTQLVEFHAEKLFKEALRIMEDCKEKCDASCYRCLRTFKNKFEHGLLDRHVGIELARFILTGEMPRFDIERVQKSTEALYQDLIRNQTDGIHYSLKSSTDGSDSKGVILAVRKDGKKYAIAICGPLTPEIPANTEVKKIYFGEIKSDMEVIPIEEFLIRNNLPSATKTILEKVA